MTKLAKIPSLKNIGTSKEETAEERAVRLLKELFALNEKLDESYKEKESIIQNPPNVQNNEVLTWDEATAKNDHLQKVKTAEEAYQEIKGMIKNVEDTIYDILPLKDQYIQLTVEQKKYKVIAKTNILGRGTLEIL